MGIVNSEGEVPSDLAEEPAMKDLLLEQVKKQGNLGDWVVREALTLPLREHNPSSLSCDRAGLNLSVPHSSSILLITHTSIGHMPKG